MEKGIFSSIDLIWPLAGARFRVGGGGGRVALWPVVAQLNADLPDCGCVVRRVQQRMEAVGGLLVTRHRRVQDCHPRAEQGRLCLFADILLMLMADKLLNPIKSHIRGI